MLPRLDNPLTLWYGVGGASGDEWVCARWSPIAFMANVDCGAIMPKLITPENHALDLPFWKDLVTGLPEVLIEDSYVRVPERPGLGVDLNHEAIEANLRFPGLFEATDEWYTFTLGFWRPDRRGRN